MTAGHWLARIGSGQYPAPGDIVIIDEFHIGQTEQALAYRRISPGIGLICFSATPSTTYTKSAGRYSADIPRRFGIKEEKTLNLQTTAITTEYIRAHGKLGRAFMTYGGIEESENNAQALNQGGYLCTAVHSGQRNVPAEGALAMTGIADTGLDVSPPIDILLDGGLCTMPYKGRLLTRVPTGPGLNTQRRGRTGRLRDGVIWQNPIAGTGKDPIIYPDWIGLGGNSDDRTWMENCLGITNPFRVPSCNRGINTLDPYAMLRPTRPMDEKTIRSVWLAVGVICSNTDSLLACAAYNHARTAGVSSLRSQWSRQWLTLYPNADVLDWATVILELESRPFIFTTDHEEVRGITLRYMDDTVRIITTTTDCMGAELRAV